VQFLAWQQAQLKGDLEHRDAVARAKREESVKPKKSFQSRRLLF